MFKQVQSFISKYKNIDADTIGMESSFTLDLGLTSYDIIEVCAYLEDQLDIEIPDEIIPYLCSAGDLTIHLERLCNESY